MRCVRRRLEVKPGHRPGRHRGLNVDEEVYTHHGEHRLGVYPGILRLPKLLDRDAAFRKVLLVRVVLELVLNLVNDEAVGNLQQVPRGVEYDSEGVPVIE